MCRGVGQFIRKVNGFHLPLKKQALRFSLPESSNETRSRILLTQLERTTHDLKIFAFLQVQERTGLTLKPLQFGAPVSVSVRLIAAIRSYFFPFFIAEHYFVPLY